MERDFVTFTDDDGNDFELDVIDYFEYEGQEYAVLMDLSEECEHGEDEECDCGHDVYIMKIVVNGDMEEFVPADEDKFDALTAIVEERMSGECCCDDDCDCEDEHEHDCGCGCCNRCDNRSKNVNVKNECHETEIQYHNKYLYPFAIGKCGY